MAPLPKPIVPPTAEKVVQNLQAPAYQQLDAQDARRTAALQNFTQAVLAQLQGGPGKVGGYYDAAINQTDQFARNAAQGLRDANPNQADQKLLDTIGAPQAQHDAVANQLGNTFGGGAASLYYGNGALPGSALAANKAAAQSYASTLPGIQGLAGTQALRSLLTQNEDARAQLRSQAPSLVLNVQQQRANAAAQAASLKSANYWKKLGYDQNQEVIRRQWNDQKFNQKLATDKFNVQQQQFTDSYNQRVDQFNARQQTAATKAAQPDWTGSKAVGYVVDSTGAPITTRNGGVQLLPGFVVRGGQVVKKGSAKTPQLSANQIQKYRGTAATIAQNAYSGFTTTDKNGSVTHPPIDYAAALNEMDKEGVPTVIAVKKLNQWYKPGERGRPTIGPATVTRKQARKAVAPPAWTGK